jgi:hypothetical protein
MNLRLIFGLMALVMCTSFAPHKYYVSKTNIEFNARTGGYEITMKFFTDDFERALGATDDHPLRLGSPQEAEDANERIENYITQKFVMKFNNTFTPMRFVGKEVENDLTYCYFEYTPPTEWHSLEFYNTFLIELFPDQENVVDFTWNTTTRTLIFVRDHQSETIFQ